MPATSMRQMVGNAAQRVLLPSKVGYDMWLWRHYGVPPWRRAGPPRARRACAVLREHNEVEEAEQEVRRLNLPAFGIHLKFWDALAAVGTILGSTSPRDSVLDAGAELYSPILPWLSRYGYDRLVGCNIVFKSPRRHGPIVYEYGDITRTGYAPGTFAAVTCMSVIEHGVDVSRFFPEMGRIVRPGGLLVLSTDYWEAPVDTGGRTLFGVPHKIFDRPGIEALIEEGRRAHFTPVAEPEFACRDRVVSWNGMDYTFLLLTFRLDR